MVGQCTRVNEMTSYVGCSTAKQYEICGVLQKIHPVSKCLPNSKHAPKRIQFFVVFSLAKYRSLWAELNFARPLIDY